MDKDKQPGLGDELFGTRLGEYRDASGPVKREFVPPPDVVEEEAQEALPELFGRFPDAERQAQPHYAEEYGKDRDQPYNRQRSGGGPSEHQYAKAQGY